MSGLPSGLVNTIITDSSVTITDLSGYFPPYEIVTASFVNFTRTPGAPIDETLNISRNKSGSTKYTVINSIFLASGDVVQMSDRIYPVLIHSKTDTGFNYVFAVSGQITNVTFTINFLVIYADPNANNMGLVTSLKFKNGATDTSGTDLVNHFPQYATYSVTYDFLVDSQPVECNIKSKAYTGNSLNYKLFGAYEYISGDVKPSVFATYLSGQILYLTETYYRDDIKFYYGFEAYPNTAVVAVDTLVLFPVPSGSWISTSDDYTTNFKSNISTTSTPNKLNLSSIFPRCRCFDIPVNNTNTGNTGQISIGVTTNNYYVFASYFYNTENGSGSVYNVYGASKACNQIIISNKGNTQFTWTFTKTDGDRWDGGITFLVIFP